MIDKRNIFKDFLQEEGLGPIGLRSTDLFTLCTLIGWLLPTRRGGGKG